MRTSARARTHARHRSVGIARARRKRPPVVDDAAAADATVVVTSIRPAFKHLKDT